MTHRRHFLSMLAAAGTAAATPVMAAPAFDPRSLRGKVAGNLTEILVLGTAHLSAFANLDARLLEPVLDRLAKFKPDLITIEALSGESLYQLEAYIPQSAATYGKRILALGRPAEAASGLTRPQAALRARDILADQPPITAAGRRQLALLLAASGDPTSALVQWLRLAPAERIAADGLTDELVTGLNTLMTVANENYLLAAPLAARLDLERVHAVDDHSADDTGDDLPQALRDKAGDEIMAAWKGADHTYSDAYQAASKNVTTPQAMLDLYRWLNAPENQRADANEQWQSLLAYDSPDRLARGYNGWWETRNLRMVANIREAVASRPGQRALVIVGASHKPYFDAYLDLMPDIRLADAETVLN